MKVFKRCIKVVVVLGIFVAIIFTVLSSLGGNGDTYKNAIETVLEEGFVGHRASVDTLNQMRFFPYLGFDLEGLELMNEQDSKLVVIAGKAQAAMGFWDVAFGTGKISSLHVQNLGIQGGYIHPETIIIERAAILTRGSDAKFEMNGRVGDQLFSLQIPMTQDGKEDSPRFSFPKDRLFSARVDDIELSGKISRVDDVTSVIKSFILTSDGVALTGDVNISHDTFFSIEGDLSANEDRTVSISAQIQGNEKISGFLRIENKVDANEIEEVFEVLGRAWFGKPLTEFSGFKIEGALIDEKVL